MSVQRLLTRLRPGDWLSVLLPSSGNVQVDDVLERCRTSLLTGR